MVSCGTSTEALTFGGSIAQSSPDSNPPPNLVVSPRRVCWRSTVILDPLGAWEQPSLSKPVQFTNTASLQTCFGSLQTSSENTGSVLSCTVLSASSSTFKLGICEYVPISFLCVLHWHCRSFCCNPFCCCCSVCIFYTIKPTFTPFLCHSCVTYNFISLFDIKAFYIAFWHWHIKNQANKITKHMVNFHMGETKLKLRFLN